MRFWCRYICWLVVDARKEKEVANMGKIVQIIVRFEILFIMTWLANCTGCYLGTLAVRHGMWHVMVQISSRADDPTLLFLFFVLSFNQSCFIFQGLGS